MRNLVIRILDVFYPVFKPFLSKQNYYYAAIGGANMVLDLFLYFIAYHYIFKKQVVQVTEFLAFEPYIAAFIFAFLITFPTGFLLSKYIVWTESNIRGRIQLFRYLLLVIANIILNYVLLKFFIEICHIYPTPSKLLTIIIVVTFSYLTQKHFTFRVKK
ncbi:MAG TPA: GtrA family protein [Brumimicrobium sp.]|nr:GtrA family protein [Brumimicrobium sp.]